MNTAQEKEDFPQAMLLSASALLYWLWPLHALPEDMLITPYMFQ